MVVVVEVHAKVRSAEQTALHPNTRHSLRGALEVDTMAVTAVVVALEPAHEFEANSSRCLRENAQRSIQIDQTHSFFLFVYTPGPAACTITICRFLMNNHLNK